MALSPPARKEAMTSHACCHWEASAMSVGLQNHALEILGLGDIQQDRMVRTRAATYQQPTAALCISRGGCHYAMKLIPGNVVGAGASHQRATRTQHLQSAQIELFVTAQGARHGALGLGKSGGIEHHRVKSSARSAPIAEKIECVGLDPLDRCL